MHDIALDRGDLPARLMLGIRPEHLSRATGPADLIVTPDMIENTGAECYLHFTLAGASVTAKRPGWMAEDQSGALGLSVNRTKITLFDAETGRRLTDAQPPLDTPAAPP